MNTCFVKTTIFHYSAQIYSRDDAGGWPGAKIHPIPPGSATTEMGREGFHVPHHDFSSEFQELLLCKLRIAKLHVGLQLVLSGDRVRRSCAAFSSIASQKVTCRSTARSLAALSVHWSGASPRQTWHCLGGQAYLGGRQPPPWRQQESPPCDCGIYAACARRVGGRAGGRGVVCLSHVHGHEAAVAVVHQQLGAQGLG